MIRVEVGAIVLYKGQLARVLAIGEGRSVTLDLIDADACPICGHGQRVELLDHAPLFQDNVRPVKTAVEQ